MPAKPKTITTAAGGVELLPLPTAPAPGAMSKEPLENPAPPGDRQEIREVTRRVMGSRQSERKVERSHQRRQPKRGHGSQRPATKQ